MLVKKNPRSSGALLGTKKQPKLPKNSDSGLVPLLKQIRQNRSRDSIIQSEINALTALGSKLNDEISVKENRVKGKADSYKPIKDLVAKVHAAHKSHTGKNPSLKVLVKKLKEQYPEGQKKKDGLPKEWTEAGLKPWLTALNQVKPF